MTESGTITGTGNIIANGGAGSVALSTSIGNSGTITNISTGIGGLTLSGTLTGSVLNVIQNSATSTW